MSLPLLLYPAHPHDPHFRYACGFDLEQGLYLCFGSDELLVVTSLELERGRIKSRVNKICDRDELGWQDESDRFAAWAKLAGRLLGARGWKAVRVSPLLPAVLYEHLRTAGLEPKIDDLLFSAERRIKSEFEVKSIVTAQDSAIAACVAVIRAIAEAKVENGQLFSAGAPLTSERLKGIATGLLIEQGCSCEEMIIAGFPECALPHGQGSGAIWADAPVVIDIFPRHLASGYHGDLTRTVVPANASAQVADMHNACRLALVAGLAEIVPGSDTRTIHRTVAKALVDSGYGSKTVGLEGDPLQPQM
ncbi:MAG: M24 family metallopeptidase, partial [Candidatus Dormibacteraceae bacterium]